MLCLFVVLCTICFVKTIVYSKCTSYGYAEPDFPLSKLKSETKTVSCSYIVFIPVKQAFCLLGVFLSRKLVEILEDEAVHSAMLLSRCSLSNCILPSCHGYLIDDVLLLI